MNRFLLALMIAATFFPENSHAVNPLNLPRWSEDTAYQSHTEQTVAFREQEYISYGGVAYGLGSGFGLDAGVCKKLSRYLCGGGRMYLGILKSHGIVRNPTNAEALTLNPLNANERNDIMSAPSVSWFALIPEIGFTVHTQIIPLADDRFSESAWFGFGKAFIGGHTGWAISFEPGINRKFDSNKGLGWTFRAKYTFGWLQPLDTLTSQTFPYDWLNLTAGIFYVW